MGEENVQEKLGYFLWESDGKWTCRDFSGRKTSTDIGARLLVLIGWSEFFKWAVGYGPCDFHF